MEAPVLPAANPADSGTHILGRPLGLALIAFYKAAWGLLELISGVFLMLSMDLLAHELSEDPQDLFANWITGHFHLARQTAVEAGIAIAILGILKIALGIVIWLRVPHVREIGLAVFAIITIFGVYVLATHTSALTISAFILDLIALYYFWVVLPKHVRRQGTVT